MFELVIVAHLATAGMNAVGTLHEQVKFPTAQACRDFADENTLELSELVYQMMGSRAVVIVMKCEPTGEGA
jgi:hypothetical protein